MTSSASHPTQLRVEQVSFTPQLFSSTKPNAKELTAAKAHYLLRDVSFRVFRGDRIAIVGASGAGKTSLLRLLNRLSEPTEGTLYLENQAYPTIPVVQLRQQVVLVLQESKLLGMTVQDALAYPLHLRGLSKQVVSQRVGEWLERLQIPSDWLNRTEQQLSVGQRQLVAIARAVLIQPKILLLDEPTSALDVGRTQLVLNVLADLAQHSGTTILMVNHQLELAKQFGDRILHLQQGMLVQDQSAKHVDWDALHHSLQQATVQAADEW
ncbi:MAG: ATP-binding cassette domain-containing protein [Leptolyngbyaceae cyanobacterium RU_5_1]|nr:ATP-binding cassette domain-containing protein [Leptolyngbyaceae cyanobacterium RU_5_1]